MADQVTPLLGGGLVYEQVAEGIRHQVLSGAMQAGDQVMSVAAYAATHRINPATAQRAFAVLVDEGVLEKRRGIGMFITVGAKNILLSARRNAYREGQLAPAVAAGRLLGFTEREILDLTTQCLKEHS